MRGAPLLAVPITGRDYHTRPCLKGFSDDPTRCPCSLTPEHGACHSRCFGGYSRSIVRLRDSRRRHREAMSIAFCRRWRCGTHRRDARAPSPELGGAWRCEINRNLQFRGSSEGAQNLWRCRLLRRVRAASGPGFILGSVDRNGPGRLSALFKPLVHLTHGGLQRAKRLRLHSRRKPLVMRGQRRRGGLPNRRGREQ